MIYNIESNAKINLGLNITGVLDNGYHLLDMIMIPISLSDRIIINMDNKAGDLKIKTNVKGIPTDKQNILYKIYDSFYKNSGIEKREISLYLEKNIPHEAGLGGGSSNGAFFLNFLNTYHGNIFTEEELIKIGEKIGADIPFFLINKSARVSGIGEKIEVIENNLNKEIIIIKPNFGVSTAVAYKNIGKLKNKKNADIYKIIQGLKNNELEMIESSIENHLEQGLLADDKNIISFRESLNNIKGMKFYMSGSGSAYYTFVDSKQAKEKLEILKRDLHHCGVYLCRGL